MHPGTPDSPSRIGSSRRQQQGHDQSNHYNQEPAQIPSTSDAAQPSNRSRARFRLRRRHNAYDAFSSTDRHHPSWSIVPMPHIGDLSLEETASSWTTHEEGYDERGKSAMTFQEEKPPPKLQKAQIAYMKVSRRKGSRRRPNRSIQLERQQGYDGNAAGHHSEDEDSKYSVRHEEVPTDCKTFEGIDLLKHNPDNHQLHMEELACSPITIEDDSSSIARKYAEIMQIRRAFGWMTNVESNEHGHQGKKESLAVHAVNASKEGEDIVIYPKKEQNDRKKLAWQMQEERYRNQKHMGVDPARHMSKHEDLHKLDNDLQLWHDEREREQLNRYFEQFKAGRLPRLHKENEGFRLTKSREKQQLTRLYPDRQMKNAPEEEQERMEEENNRKMWEHNIYYNMDELRESSDEEYQQPREI